MRSKAIILFDGVCNLCTGSVQWIIKHDPDSYFGFANLQSDVGMSYVKKFNIPRDLDSVILIENGRVYSRSAAALRIALKCSGFWKWLYAFIIVPPFIRDAVYNFIAKRRYLWFGKKEECWLPLPEYTSRFINKI